jgi:hypothetical protein
MLKDEKAAEAISFRNTKRKLEKEFCQGPEAVSKAGATVKMAEAKEMDTSCDEEFYLKVSDIDDVDEGNEL